MKPGLREVKVKWDHEAEKNDRYMGLPSGRTLGEDDIAEKKKENIATARLNKHLAEDLGLTEQYSESAVHHKVDNFWKKGKQMYPIYQQKKREIGKVYGETGQVYRETGQVHVYGETGQVYGETGQVYGETGQVYGETGQVYGETGQVYGETGQVYGETGQVYGETGN